jgi:hypothetical protein
MSTKMLQQRSMPPWLSSIKDYKDLDHILLESILENSLFYPASGRDGDPIKYLSGYIHSFIYADNGVTEKQLINSLENQNRNFLGYHVEFIKSENFICCSTWVILKRISSFDAKFGPERISLLFVHNDFMCAFQGLYSNSKKCPEIIALIKSGWMGSDNHSGDGELAEAVNIVGRPSYMLECAGKGRNLSGSYWGTHFNKIFFQEIKYDDVCDLVLWG